MDRENALNKIKKLFALAGSDNEGEAKAALASAQRLMAQFGIKEVELESKAKDNVSEDEFETTTKGVSPTTSSLVNALAKHYRCVCYLSRSWDNKTKLMVAGYPDDVALFKEIAAYAVNTQDTLFKKFLKTAKSPSRSESIRMKNTYCLGFCTGIVKALEENENKYALMVMPDKNVLAVVEKMHATHSHRQFSSSDAAYSAGHRDGSDALKLRNSLT
jgi:hypothetical protein